jgi:hypothetical protein
MDESDRDTLRKLAAMNVCPNCGNSIQTGKRHQYGVGAFCSLDCVAQFNAAELIERHRRILAAFKRHQN